MPPSLSIENTKRPSIVTCDTDSKKNQAIYDAWASNYECDIRAWKYDMPERVAELLSAHKKYLGADEKKRSQETSETSPEAQTQTKILIFDAGAGDGLSGVALRNSGFDKDSTYIVGGDVSSKMLDIANHRDIYDETKVVDLNNAPLLFETDAFDAVTCVGTLTYIHPGSGVLDEFVRITRPGGLICFTSRSDQLDKWHRVQDDLDSQGKWKLESDPIGPLPYLPDNPEYGKEVEAIISLYRVL